MLWREQCCVAIDQCHDSANWCYFADQLVGLGMLAAEQHLTSKGVWVQHISKLTCCCGAILRSVNPGKNKTFCPAATCWAQRVALKAPCQLLTPDGF
jgi:hypothetical protein